MSSFWNLITLIPLHLIKYSSSAVLSSQKSSIPCRPRADAGLRGPVREKFGRPLVSTAGIAEWPSITTLRRKKLYAIPSAQVPHLIKGGGGADWEETVQ